LLGENAALQKVAECFGGAMAAGMIFGHERRERFFTF
jgi:hypothetical protein